MSPAPSDGEASFQRVVARVLLTFLGVVVIDLTFGSLFSDKWRLWFPQWIDPTWAVNPRARVVYSQSYLSGVFLLPVLVWAIDRDFLARGRAAVRAGFWAVCFGAFAFILIWKGGLMLEFHKQREALAWAVLTALIYAIIVIAQAIPARLARLSRNDLLARLALGVASFFLVMSVLDPVMQIGVQHLGWSNGLIVEVVFFVPAGMILLLVAHGLRRAVIRSDVGPAKPTPER